VNIEHVPLLRPILHVCVCAYIYLSVCRSIYQLTMLATPYLIASQGNIVNVSSVNGLRSFSGVLAYNISKAAVDQFTRCVAIGEYPTGVEGELPQLSSILI